jgi:hypothetical protein
MNSEQRRQLADRFARAVRRRDRRDRGRQFRQQNVDASMQEFLRGISKTKLMWIAAAVLALVLFVILIESV